jgi:hypothetical protein
MRAGVDESMFAGLLLMTKCPKETIAQFAHEATSILVGETLSKGSKGDGGFLKRLLLSEAVQSTSHPHAEILSPMQLLGLNVTNSLGSSGDKSVRMKLWNTLGSTLTSLLNDFVRSTLLSNEETVLLGNMSAVEEILECMHCTVVSTDDDGDNFVWPPALLESLIRILRAKPQQRLSATASASVTSESDVEIVADQSSYRSASSDTHGPAEKQALGSKAASLAFDILLWGLTHQRTGAGAVSTLVGIMSLAVEAPTDRAATGETAVPDPTAAVAATASAVVVRLVSEQAQRGMALELVLQWLCSRLSASDPLDSVTAQQLAVE